MPISKRFIFSFEIAKNEAQILTIKLNKDYTSYRNKIKMELIESRYELELEKVIQTINKKKARLVCLQLPEALKPLATKITDEIEKNTQAKCLIWLGSCFGACDIPNLDHIKPKVDLLVQWGHAQNPAGFGQAEK